MSLDPKALGLAVIIAVSTVCLCLVTITGGFVVYLILHDGATPAAMFDTLQSIAQWALAALAALVGVHQAAGAIIARAQSGAATAAPGASQAAAGVNAPAPTPAPSDVPPGAPNGYAQPVALAQGG
jgi:hypothetical protein